jgi:hypothetical protein
MTVTNNIYQKQIKYHVFNAVMNSELTELVPVFTIQSVFPTSVKKVNISFKNVWRTQHAHSRTVVRVSRRIKLMHVYIERTLRALFTFLTEVGNTDCIVNTGTSSVNSEFITALNT